MKTINELFNSCSLLYGEKIMFETYNDEKYTFSQITEKVREMQNVLYYYGVRKGDKVAVFIQDSPAWVISYFAITTMGSVIVPMMVHKDAGVINKVANESDCHYLLLSDGILSEKAISGLREDTQLCVIDAQSYRCIVSPYSVKSITPLEDNSSMVLPDVDVKSFDLAAMKVTYDKYSVSITSFSHEELMDQAFANAEKYRNNNNVNEDIYMSIFPMSMMSKKLSSVMVPMINGCITIFPPKSYKFNKIVRYIKEIKPSILITAPRFIELFYKSSMVNQKSKEIIDLKESTDEDLSSFTLRKQGSRIYKILGGKIRYCFTEKIENSKIEKFLKASGLTAKMKFLDI